MWQENDFQELECLELKRDTRWSKLDKWQKEAKIEVKNLNETQTNQNETQTGLNETELLKTNAKGNTKQPKCDKKITSKSYKAYKPLNKSDTEWLKRDAK